jgi:TPR repeat protein
MLRKAANNPDYIPISDNTRAHAMTAVGDIFSSGKEPFGENHTQAMAWYRKASDLGHMAAKYNLCVYYLKGNVTLLRKVARASTIPPNFRKVLKGGGEGTAHTILHSPYCTALPILYSPYCTVVKEKVTLNLVSKASTART